MEQKEVVPLDFKQVAHLLVVHKQAEPFITEALKRFVRHKEMADILIQYAHAAGEVIEETKEGTRCPHCHYRYSRGELFKTEEDCYICCECGLKFKIEQEIIEICHTTTKKVYDEDIKNNSKNPSIIDSCRNAGKIILKKVKKVLVGGWLLG